MYKRTKTKVIAFVMAMLLLVQDCGIVYAAEVGSGVRIMNELSTESNQGNNIVEDEITTEGLSETENNETEDESVEQETEKTEEEPAEQEFGEEENGGIEEDGTSDGEESGETTDEEGVNSETDESDDENPEDSTEAETDNSGEEENDGEESGEESDEPETEDGETEETEEEIGDEEDALISETVSDNEIVAEEKEIVSEEISMVASSEDIFTYNGTIVTGLKDGYESVTELVIPEGVTEIGSNAFSGNTSITSVVLPESLKVIGKTAFYNCSSLSEVELETTRLQDCSYDSYPGNGIFTGCSIERIIFAEGTERIPANLFYNAGMDYYAEITIPASIKVIGGGAFCKASRLSEVIFAGNNVTEIGASAFAGTGIIGITLPESLILIGEYAFDACASLDEIVIPGKVTTIGRYAFRNCTQLKKVVIPASVKTMGDYMFNGCDKNSLKIYAVKNSTAYNWAVKNGYAIGVINSIKYNLNGGTNNPENPSTYETGDYIAFADPTRTGYTFGGWYTDSKCTSTKKIESTDGQNGNLTLYAKWNIIKYDITYELDGGTVTGNPATYDVSKTVIFKNPAKTGYTFLGWYIIPEDETIESENAVKVTDTKGYAENLVLTAKWQENTYNITFMGNGGTTEDGKTSKTINSVYSAELQLIDNSFIRKGYTFAGWNTRKDGKGTTYNDREMVSKLSVKNNADITLYAMWELETYWITYDLNGDDVKNTSPASYNVTKDVTLKNPTRAGYTFGGWYEDEEFKTAKVTKISKNRAEDITLYAKWTENTYNVTFNLNGGTAAEGAVINNPKEIGYETVITIPTAEEVIRVGYTLKGWNTKKDGKGTSYGLKDTRFKATNLPSKNNGTLTLYAIWEMNTYNITYVNCDAPVKNSNPAAYNVKKDVTLKNPTKTGYTFGGWYEDEEFKTAKVTKIAKTTDRDITLYAKWTENTYTVKFDLNKGMKTETGNIDGYPELGYTEAIRLPKAEEDVAREGYTLKEWNTKKDGKGTSYGLEDTFFLEKDLPKDKGTLTLYAIWELDSYSIDYENCDETVKNSNPTKYNKSKDITLKNPTRAGYTFGGWYENYENGEYRNKITKILKTWTKDITLYAKWTPNTYNVTFNLNGGKVTENGEVTNLSKISYEDTITIPTVEDVARAGYILREWNTKKDGKGTSYELAATGFKDTNLPKNNQTLTLYAIWETVTYNIEYVTKGEDVQNKNPQEYNVTKEITLKNPTRTGYTFGGWYKDGNFETADKVTKIKKGTTGNIRLYAKWTENVYTVKFNANGGKGSAANVVNQKYTELMLLPGADVFARDGYILTGWNTKKDGKGIQYSLGSVKKLSAKNKSTVTLYADWKPEHEIIYLHQDINGQEFSMEQMENIQNPNPEAYNYKQDVKLKAATKEGYTFQGWYTEKGTKVTIVKKTGTGDITLIGKWKPNTYTVKFHANGGTGEMDKMTGCIYDKTFTLPSNTFTKEGYTFVGWSTRGFGGKVEYTDEEEVQNLSSANNGTVTLYARWVKE